MKTMKLKIYTAIAALALVATYVNADEVSDRIQAGQRQDQRDQDMRQAQESSAQFWADYEIQFEADYQRRQAALGADDDNRAQDWWGAIAVNLASGAGAWNANHLSGGNSLKEIQRYCEQNDCELVAVFKNTCVAAAQNLLGSLFWADDVKEDLAIKNATAKCRLDKASGTSCKTSKDHVACSGYQYQKYRGKLSNFNRGGLLGVIWPKFSGIPAVQPASVIYKPAAVLLTLQARSLRDADAISATHSMEAGKNITVWGAMATSESGGFGLGLGITEAIAKADALKKCANPACAVNKSYQGGICVAAVSGNSVDGKAVGAVDALKTKELAENAVMNGCKARGWLNCKIIVTQCVDGTSLQ
jgi:Domain of unknown function (DUF4189)